MKNILKELLVLLMCCSLGACSSSPKKEEVKEETASQDETAEVVVIGAGGAGIAAALTAADEGTHVVLLEQENSVGGVTIAAAVGVNGGNSRLQNELEKPYTTEDFYQGLVDGDWDPKSGSGAKVSDEYARTYAEETGPMIDWLESIGMELIAVPERDSVQLADTSKGKFGYVLVSTLKEQLESHKDFIDLRLGNKATQLLVGENGEITGVVVESETGSYTISSSAVIIATGGWTAAPVEFYEKYAPSFTNLTSDTSYCANGSGIELVEAIGGYYEDIDHITVRPISVGGEINKTAAMTMTSCAKNGAILVNVEGNRFINETSGAAELLNAQNAQTDGKAFVIFDQATYDLSSDCQSADKAGYLQKADTVEELAELLGVDAEALQASFDTATAGNDELGREEFASELTTAPFYGAATTPSKHFSQGGIVLNGEGQVMNANQEPIVGLWAAGEVTAYGKAPVTSALCWGRITARNAVNFLAK